jgi:hypothetical protein
MYKYSEKFNHHFWKDSGKKMISMKNDNCRKALNMSETWEKNKRWELHISTLAYIKSKHTKS